MKHTAFLAILPAVGNHPEEVTRQGYAGIFHHRRIGGSESTWEDEVCNGTGKSVGAELSAACTSVRWCLKF